ncbi:ABC transporter permease [Occultella glacieicola]|uniref:ABC transporter permease n=1 Tax=Occultella glacieicola TaxID=2518684 RepID=A0ABY2DZB5_9MICO|nr:ABC transporter permease [Occultella glacieicola]TDE90033.1 ABC transporter permease [Occultella glacieicola]
MGTRGLAAELDKLRTLPAIGFAIVGAVLTGVVIAGALVASAAAAGTPASVVEIVLAAVPFVQVPIIVLGVLPAGQEYDGRQIATTLVAMPDRARALAGKTMAATAVVGLGTALSVGAALTTGVIAAGVAEVTLTSATAPWRLAGAVGYLTIIGLLAHVVAVALRQLVPALVATLALIVVISPLSAGLTEHARWLPDRAASQLYADTDALLTTATGPLGALAWIAAIGTLAAVRFIRLDP